VLSEDDVIEYMLRHGRRDMRHSSATLRGLRPAVALATKTANHRAITQGWPATGAGMEAGAADTPHNA